MLHDKVTLCTQFAFTCEDHQIPIFPHFPNWLWCEGLESTLEEATVPGEGSSCKKRVGIGGSLLGAHCRLTLRATSQGRGD